MVADYTTTGLLASIRRRAMLPSSSSSGTADADLLAFANDELRLRLPAALVGTREEFFVTYTDLAVSGTEYRIPSRALGMAVREVALVAADGSVRHLPRVRVEERDRYNGGGSGFVYYVRGNNLVLLPGGPAAAFVRVWYAIRPSELTSTAADFKAITGINGGTVTVSSSVGLTGSVDLVSASAFDVLAAGVTAQSSDAVSLTFASVPAGLAVGDYVCVADKSPVPNLPNEYHVILAQRAAISVCAALGDFEAVDRLTGDLLQMEKEAGLVLVTPRTQGSPQKVHNRVNAIGTGRHRSRYAGG